MVKLKIGNYHDDEVLYDIILKDVFHLLLGRSWQFDSRTIHDGHANTYSPMKDGVHHKLMPLIKEDEMVCSSARICLFYGRFFLDSMKLQHMCYALIPRNNKESSNEVLVEFLGLLSEYRDVISDNVLEGLPLVRKINHQIDLVPRDSFPNKAAHRMTLNEIQELNRQV